MGRLENSKIGGNFADAVADYSPVIIAGEPTAPHRVASNALGAPGSGDVSLGRGGSITLEFIDNILTPSGDASADLHPFTGDLSAHFLSKQVG